MSTVRKESSITALECALRSDGSAKKTVKFKSAVIRSNRSCFIRFSGRRAVTQIKYHHQKNAMLLHTQAGIFNIK